MTSVKILNKREVETYLDMKHVVEAVEKAYAYKCDSKAEVFPIVCHSFDEESELDIKSGSVEGAGVFGMKLVSAFARNDEYGLPRLMGTILVFDSNTGVLKSIMDGGCITNMRTGAAGAVGCKFLARPESETLVLVGTGAQASNLIAATLETMENIKKIYVCNPRSIERAGKFCEELPEVLLDRFFSKYKDTEHYDVMKKRAELEIIPTEDLESACREADIILTATPSRVPLVQAEWVKPGTHISCIGSDMEGKQEIDEKILEKARVFCDDRTQVINVGECEKAVKAGVLNAEDITEIGDVLLKKAEGRVNKGEITVFDSTGIALQDLMTAAVITEVAEKKQLGMNIEL